MEVTWPKGDIARLRGPCPEEAHFTGGNGFNFARAFAGQVAVQEFKAISTQAHQLSGSKAWMYVSPS